MALKVEIAGVDQAAAKKIDLDAGITVNLGPVNNRATATFTCIRGYIPDRFDEVTIYKKDGVTPLFGGVIVKRPQSSGQGFDAQLVRTTVEVGDYMTYTQWCYTSLTYSATTTLKQVLLDLVTEKLSAYGIAVDAGQVDGPNLAAFTWENKRVDEALRELAERTGYVIRITAGKKLTAFVLGTDPAPYSMTDAAPHCTNITWGDGDALPANYVELECGQGQQARSEDFAATVPPYGGGLAYYTTSLPASQNINDAWPNTLVVNGAVIGPVSWGDDVAFAWWWDYENHRLTHVEARGGYMPVGGDVITIAYTAQYPFVVSATSGASPRVEYREARPDVFDADQAQEIADGLLEEFDQEPRTLEAETVDDGFEPGQSLTVNLTARSIAGTFYIDDVVVRILTADNWEYTVSAVETSTYQGSYQDQWRALTGGGGTSVAVVSGSGGSSGTVNVSAVYLGGSRDRGVHKNPAAWSPVVDYVSFVATASFSGVVRVELKARNAGIGVKARLYNVTDAASVQESSLVTSQTFQATSFLVAIVSGKTYRLELLADTADQDAYAIGTLESV